MSVLIQPIAYPVVIPSLIMQQPIEVPGMSGAQVPVIQGGARPISYSICENYTIHDNPPSGNAVDNG